MATTELAALRAQPAVDDQAVDMFTARGFELAIRIGKAFATSNAVPAQFRNFTEKKVQGSFQLIENPAALGNCIVAIETARAVGMSITAVMQQANIIEGKLSWSAQFVIGAINASRRFTPLRFNMKNLGRIEATYKEKQGWNDAKRGFDFVDRKVSVENIECIAWALPHGMTLPAFTLDQMRQASLLDLVRAAGLPVVESAPVSMKMAVEEGWYGKSGSKWQTEMRTLMLQYRAGAFFGRIHAPDIVMGMGRTSEEIVDMTTVDVAPDGRVTGVTVEQLRKNDKAPTETVVVEQVNASGDDEQGSAEAAFSVAEFVKNVADCKDLAGLQALSDIAEGLPAGDDREAAMAALLARDAELAKTSATAATPAAATRGRGRAAAVAQTIE